MINIEEYKINYASFGERLVAFILDGIILGAALVVLAILGSFILINAIDIKSKLKFLDDEDGITIFYFIIGAVVLIYALGILYRSLFESSSLQGTPGKYILKLNVVDKNLQRISLPTALLRNFVKIFSKILFYIGYMIALRDRRCLTLHDLAAGTIVVKENFQGTYDYPVF